MNLKKYPAMFEKIPYNTHENHFTILDWYAGQALPAVVTAQIDALKGQINPMQIGMISYAIALGMMQAREMPEEAFMPKPQEEQPVGKEETAPVEEPKIVMP